MTDVVMTAEVDEQLRRETEELMQSIRQRFPDGIILEAQTPKEMREALIKMWYRSLAQSRRFDDSFRYYCEQLSLLIKRADNEPLLS